MNQVVFDLDDATAALVETMAKAEGITVEQLSKEAIAESLKKFTDGCITTLLRKTS